MSAIATSTSLPRRTQQMKEILEGNRSYQTFNVRRFFDASIYRAPRSITDLFLRAHNKITTRQPGKNAAIILASSIADQDFLDTLSSESARILKTNFQALSQNQDSQNIQKALNRILDYSRVVKRFRNRLQTDLYASKLPKDTHLLPIKPRSSSKRKSGASSRSTAVAALSEAMTESSLVIIEGKLKVMSGKVNCNGQWHFDGKLGKSSDWKGVFDEEGNGNGSFNMMLEKGQLEIPEYFISLHENEEHSFTIKGHNFLGEIEINFKIEVENSEEIQANIEYNFKAEKKYTKSVSFEKFPYLQKDKDEYKRKLTLLNASKSNKKARK